MKESTDPRLRALEASEPSPMSGGDIPHDRDPDGTVRATPAWIGDIPPDQGLAMYLDVLRARLGIVALVVAIALGGAAFYLSQTEKVYEAEADLLVTPVPDDNQNLFGLGLVTRSGDPTRDAETLAQLLTTPSVAERVRKDLKLTQTARSLLKNVSAEPVAQSSIVTITARANDPVLAARLANGFGKGAIDVRTARMRRLLDSVVPKVRGLLNRLPSSDVRSREALTERLRDLETLRALPDPTLHLETLATPPASPIAPRPVLTVVAALIAALVLAVAVVLGKHLLDTRIEREEDLRRYRVPVIGRIPRERPKRRLGHRAPLLPDQLSTEGRDAFHRLASALAARSPSGSQTIFVTAAAPAAGKTTTSLNLTVALAALKREVILLEADSRRPALASALGLARPPDLTDAAEARTVVEGPFVWSKQLPGVRILAQTSGEWSPAAGSPDEADRLLSSAQVQASWAVFDGPALNYAPDALPLAKRVARVLLVVRLRSTRVRDLADLADLLTQQGITPDGFILIGVKPRPTYF